MSCAVALAQSGCGGGFHWDDLWHIHHVLPAPKNDGKVVAAQVNQPGDRASGFVRNLMVQSDHDTAPKPVTTPCMYEDPKLHMTRTNNDYEAQGVFKAGAGVSIFVETLGPCT
jgi:hypothetical protein